jgi:hypothetical protein
LAGPTALLVILLTSCSAAENTPTSVPAAAPTGEPVALESAPASDPVGDLTAAPAPSATALVPAPGGGDVTTEVDAGKQELLDAVPVGTPVDVDGRVSVRIVEATRTRGEARTVGEIAGPAVQLRVVLTNESRRAMGLSGVTVTAHDAENRVLTTLGSAPARPFRGRVAAGRDADGIYIFTIPRDDSAPFTITVNYAADAPVAVFVGDLT